MFNQGSMPSLSDIAAVTNNDGLGGNNGWWILIILFALFGGWGRGGYYGDSNGSGVSEVQRGFDSQAVINKLNGLENGMASLGYEQLAQVNGVNTNITAAMNSLQNVAQQNAISQMQSNFALQSQLSDCCCQNREAISQLKYDNATSTCAITNAISQAAQQIMQNDNANYRQLHDENIALQMEAKNERIADLQSRLAAADLAASQAAQNNYLISQLRPSAVPAYTVANPYASYTGYGCCNQQTSCC